MTVNPLLHSDTAYDFAQAVILSSDTPLLMLDGQLRVLVASKSFCVAFQLSPTHVIGRSMADLGSGEWESPQLNALLEATAAGLAEVKAYEIRLQRFDRPVRTLMINAHKVDHPEAAKVRIVVSVMDVTDVRSSDLQKETLIHEKAVLFQELQHRVANSLQIIASVLMQSARTMQSDESKWHLLDAHSRVMSIAEMQRQLSASTDSHVALKPYLTNLSRSIGASLIRDRNLVSIAVEVDDSVVEAAISISLGLVVTELIINALKHAFAHGQEGKVTVAYQSNQTGWTLIVKDNGVGMDNPLGDPKAGLGSNIVKALAAQLRAKIKVTGALPGTNVTLVYRSPQGGETLSEPV